MAGVATPLAADATTSSNKKNVVEKPERPDQAKYEQELAEAEKKLTAAVERQV